MLPCYAWLPGSGAAAGAPTLTSVSTSGGAVGDIAGGYPATLTGTGFTGATGVTFGGTAATSVVVVSSTSITCTVPAHATGNGTGISVVVTTPGGSNGANTLFRFFSPAELALTFWVRADYPGAAPWSATASAGTSGSNGGLVTNTSDPTAGTAVNGHVPAAFASASSQNLVGQTAFTTLFTAAAGTIAGLYYPVSAATASGSIYDDPALAVDGGYADTGLTYTNIGFQIFIYSGAYKNVAKAAATGAWHSYIGKWDSSNINLLVDGAAATPVVAGAATLTAGVLANGRGYGAGYINGRELEMMTAAIALTTQNQSDLRSYWNTRYFPSGAQV